MPRIRIDQSNEIVQSRGENTVRIDVVVISFQFSTFVSLMQQGCVRPTCQARCD